MSEAAGLVVGGIALASLFSTCLDLFDRFELCNNYAIDYQLACTKIQLIRSRLFHWGSITNVNIPGSEDPALRQFWLEEQEVVGKSLYEIERILGSADILVGKYNINLTKASDTKSLKIHSIPKASLLCRRTLWAIHDKGKFDRLIADLSFLVENLEQVFERIHLSRTELNRPTHMHLLRVSHSQGSVPHSLIAALPADAAGHDQQSTYGSAQHDSAAKTQSEHHVVAGIQHNHNSAIGLQGVLGRTKDIYRVEGLQINHDNAFGIQGGASVEAIALLQDRAFARQQSYR